MINTNSKLSEINAATAAEINTAVPVDQHPDTKSRHGATLVDDQGGAGQSAYSAGRAALASVYKGLSEIEKAYHAQLVPTATGQKGPGATRMLIPNERKAPLADAMHAMFARTATTMERNSRVVDENLSDLEQRIAIAISNPNKDRVGTAQAASEIRQYISSLKNSGERMKFLQESIAAGELEIVSAVLGTSCWISGLNKAEFAIIREAAESRFAPREAKQRAAVQAIKKQIESATASFMQRYVKLLPRPEQSPADKALAALKMGA
jgi:hypothetical protein